MAMDRDVYKVVVGNIGMVYTGDDYRQARDIFDIYVEQSQSNYGRASGEMVTLFDCDRLVREYTKEDSGQ